MTRLFCLTRCAALVLRLLRISSSLSASVLRGGDAVDLAEELAEIGGAGKAHGLGNFGNAQIVLGQQSCRRAEPGLVAKLGKGHAVIGPDVSDGMAPYILCDEKDLIPLPDTLTYQDGAQVADLPGNSPQIRARALRCGNDRTLRLL